MASSSVPLFQKRTVENSNIRERSWVDRHYLHKSYSVVIRLLVYGEGNHFHKSAKESIMCSSWYISVITGGCGEFHCDNSSFELVPGNILVYGSIKKYSISPKPGTHLDKRYVGIYDNPAVENLLSSPYVPRILNPASENLRCILGIFDAIRENVSSGNTSGDPYLENSLLCYKLIHLLNVESRSMVPENRFESLLLKLSSSLDRNYTLADLSRICGVPTYTLNRLFHKELGSSPLRYLINMRLDFAAKILSSQKNIDPLTVAAIAHKCGYSDPLFFSREFKKRFGISPKFYREQKFPFDAGNTSLRTPGSSRFLGKVSSSGD